MELDAKIVKLRQEVNPHELLKLLNEKANAKAINESLIDFQACMKNFSDWQFETSKSMSMLKKNFKRMMPIVKEMYEANKDGIAARASNCLVCGRSEAGFLLNKRRQRSHSPPENEKYGNKMIVIEEGTRYWLFFCGDALVWKM